MDESLKTQNAEAAPVLWLVADDRPGHRNQLAGVANWMRELAGVHCEWLPAPTSRLRAMLWRLLRRFPPGEGKPAPHWILVAGERTHWAGLAARRAAGGRLIVLMRPSLPYGWFDLCCVPQHDEPPTRPNVLPTLGVANAVRAPVARKPGRVLILLGGPSRHHGWDTAAVTAQVCEIVRRTPHLHFTIADSRRTPPQALSTVCAAAKTWASGGLEAMPVDQAPKGWLVDTLSRTATVWVTADSVSMLYEAATAGAAVGVLSVPMRRRGRKRALRAQELATEVGLATTFARWRKAHKLPQPAFPLQEAQRIAQALLMRFPPDSE